MRILLAIDGSPPSQAAIEEVALRPWPRPSAVRVICVVQPYVPPAAEFVPGAGTVTEVLAEHRGEAARLVDRAAARIAKDGLTVERAALDGDPPRTIVEDARDWDADLIVVGSHGHTGFKRFLLGSVAQAVLSHAPCSVEVVRPRDAA